MRALHPCPTPIAGSAFAGFCFPPDVIVLAVRWYLRFGLSYRDVEELLAERGVDVDHVTIYRWVQRFTPLLADAARPCRHAVGDRWQVDETYVKEEKAEGLPHDSLEVVVAELEPLTEPLGHRHLVGRLTITFAHLDPELRGAKGLMLMSAIVRIARASSSTRCVLP